MTPHTPTPPLRPHCLPRSRSGVALRVAFLLGTLGRDATDAANAYAARAREAEARPPSR